MTSISKAEYLKALQRSGLTGHPGGIAGTRALIERLEIRRGQRVLDLGCGTGYTSCLIARKSGTNVVAVDLQPKMLPWAIRRAKKEHVADTVNPVAADAHQLPFRDASFDTAIVESVLVFCDLPVALAELYRVLKPGGRFGCNELTTLKPLTREERDVLAASIGIKPEATTSDEWVRALKDAGFQDAGAEVKPLDWIDLAVFTPLKTDGILHYLSALALSVTDPEIRKISRAKGAFLRSGLMRDLSSGLYWARKP